MSFISGIVSAFTQKRAAEEQINSQQKLAKQQNATNILLHYATRGGAISPESAQALGVPELAGKSSAVLPYYLSDVEQNLGMQAGAMSKAIASSFGSPASQLAQAKGTAAGFAPAAAASDQLANQLSRGELTPQMMREAAPVMAATSNIGKVKRNAGLEALADTLNETDAIQARKGYAGDSFGNRMMRFGARRAIMSGAAADTAGATLANARMTQQIQGGGRALQLQNLNLPDERTSAALERTNLPASMLARRSVVSLGPVAPFNIGPRGFDPAVAIPPDTTGGKWGFAAGLASLGQQEGQGLEKTALQRWLNSGSNPNPGNAPMTTEPGGTQTGGALDAPVSNDYGGEMGMSAGDAQDISDVSSMWGGGTG